MRTDADTNAGAGTGAEPAKTSPDEAQKLRKKVDADSHSLLASLGAPLSTGTLAERVGRLRDMDWLADRVSPRGDGKKRWPAVLIVIITAALLAFLLGTPSSSGVAIDAVTRSVQFQLPRVGEGGEFASVLGRLSGESLVLEGTAQLVPKSAPMKVEARSATLSVPAGSALTITQFYLTHDGGKEPSALTLISESDRRLRICASNAKLSLDIQVPDAAQADGLRNFQAHVSAVMPTGRKAASPACVVLETSAAVTREQLMGNMRIALLNVNGPAYRAQGQDDQADLFPSELKSAKVSFLDAPGTRAQIDEEHRLNLTAFQGQLRRVYWVKDRLQVQANGTVDLVTRSIGATQQDLMPKRLTLLRTKYSDLWVAWGLLLYLLGLGLSLLKWYGAKV